MRIHLCGSLAVEIDGHDVTLELPGRQGRRLLAYLLACRGREIRRDELIRIIWPDQLPGAPEAALRSLLAGVRRVVGHDALEGRSALRLELGPDVWIDVDAARAAAAAAKSAMAAGGLTQALDRAGEAVRLTRRPVLAEMQDEWVSQLRGELAELHCDQLETAARAALAIGGAELATGERLARSLIVLEPYRESGYALLMETLAAAGNVAEALGVYDDLRVLLREELGGAPAVPLQALHARLLTHGGVAASAPAPVAPPPPLELGTAVPPLPGQLVRSDSGSFVAREAELQWLHARWDAACERRGELVLLTGEPGMGKTRLAARFAAELHADGTAVLYGRADRETVVPYQPFVEAFRPVASRLGRDDAQAALGHMLTDLHPLLPDMGAGNQGMDAPPPDAGNQRYALFDAAASLLDLIARPRPLLLILEDLHWADKPTLLLLRESVRRVRDAPIIVMATYRGGELTAAAPLCRLLADLRREHVLHRIELEGFDATETAALVAARTTDRISAEEVTRLCEYTAGNPFFIGEMLRSIADVRPALPAGWDGAIPPVPESVQDTIVRRLDRLGTATVELLTHAAVLGRDFSLAALERVDGDPPDDVLCGLEEATRAGLVSEHPDELGRFSFCHALVREAIYALPTVARRRRLHLRAGEKLESASGTRVRAAELAHHFFLARHVGGAERAVRYCLQAANEAAGAHAYEEAAALYARALEALALLPGGDDARRIEILLALGAVRWRGGEPGAREAFIEAADLARRRGAEQPIVEAALGVGGRFYAPGRLDPEYVALLKEAIAVVSPHEQAVRARLLARLAEALAVDTPGEEPEELSGQAVQTARRSGDDAATVAALLSRHAALLHVRHLDERLAVGQEALAMAKRSGLFESAALTCHWLIHDLMEAGELDGARRLHAELATLSRKLHQPLYEHSTLAWRGVLAQIAGRFEKTERLAWAGLRLAERAGTPDALANFTAQLLAIRREQGRLPELLDTLERLVAEGSAVLPWSTFLPLAYLQAGADQRAREALAVAAGEGFAAIPQRLFFLPAVAWLSEAAAELRDEAMCTRLLSMLAPHVDHLVQAGFTGCWGSAHRYAGLLHNVLGNDKQAEQELRKAIDRHRSLGATPLLRRAEGDLGTVRSTIPRAQAGA